MCTLETRQVRMIEFIGGPVDGEVSMYPPLHVFLCDIMPMRGEHGVYVPESINSWGRVRAVFHCYAC